MGSWKDKQIEEMDDRDPGDDPLLAMVLNWECDRCGDEVFTFKSDAVEFLENVLEGLEPEEMEDSLNDALSDRPMCDYCDHMMHKDD